MTSLLFACSGSRTCVDHVLPSSSEGLHAVACRLGLHQDAPGPISGAPRCLPTPARSQTAALVHPKVPRDQGPAAPPRQSHRPLQTVSAQTLTDGATLPPSQAQTRRRESGHLMLLHLRPPGAKSSGPPPACPRAYVGLCTLLSACAVAWPSWAYRPLRAQQQQLGPAHRPAQPHRSSRCNRLRGQSLSSDPELWGRLPSSSFLVISRRARWSRSSCGGTRARPALALARAQRPTPHA